MLNAPQGESPFRRLSAEDEEMFFKSSSLPVDVSYSFLFTDYNHANLRRIACMFVF